MHQSVLHLYVFTLPGKTGGGAESGERRAEGEGEGNPYVTSSPTRTRARFVSLADFCRLTRKHPWTLPPPFTFNLYQSIQSSRQIERTNMHETRRMRCVDATAHYSRPIAPSTYSPQSPIARPPLSPSFVTLSTLVLSLVRPPSALHDLISQTIPLWTSKNGRVTD
jgi:hypothetical protein